ncbi:hypothetical protein ACIHEJ_39595 [Streptomyces sp. NPDC052301]|uniref:hypothetical protein n=1 Tax=Streptomyces sp. NPDC052301 TaxID=3365687 RepID=UPI0037D17B84
MTPTPSAAPAASASHRRFRLPGLCVAGALVVFPLVGCTAVAGGPVRSEAQSLSTYATRAFAAVNLAVIGFWVRDRRAGRADARGPAAAVLQLLLPALGLVVNVALWISLDTPAKIVGVLWALAGVGILALRSGGFRHPIQTPDLAE